MPVYRTEHDEETEEPRIIYAVNRLTQDQMRETVVGLLEGQLYPSVAVDDSMISMVFMGVAFGALAPPKELIVEVMGSEGPPEGVEGDPKKPEHPGYPALLPDPPEKPTLIKPDPAMRSALEWEDIEDEEWETHLAEVEAENRERIAKWDAESMAWHDAEIKAASVRRQIDADYDAEIKKWEAELSSHKERNAAREAAKAAWVEKYERIFSRWGEEIGCLVGDMKNTFPRSINGYPMFHAFQVVHRDDWARIDAAARREAERMQNIEV
jgi:hypothetical protein